VGAMKSLLVKLPGLQEQQRIEDLLTLQASTNSNIMNKLGKFHSLKTALMQDLLTGKKRVTSLLEPETTH
jgi:type I restriction enzyme S subunit